MHKLYWTFCLLLLASGVDAQSPRRLDATTTIDSALAANETHVFVLALPRGGSASVVVRQIGVDVVVEVRGPSGTLEQSIDSPNGRDGDEPVEIISREGGRYELRVRPFDTREPAARYRLSVTALRDATATGMLLATRRSARDSTTIWLRARSAHIPSSGMVPSAGPIAPIDGIARRTRVLGIGEATHGSREMGDFRLSLTRRLIAKNGYRLVAIELSADRARVLDAYVSGKALPDAMVHSAMESGWIGRRTNRELVQWLRTWNRTHRGSMVRVVGVDAQENAISRELLANFVTRAYPETGAWWVPVARELAAADSQTPVFGNSSVEPGVRDALMRLIARINLDAPALISRMGATTVDSARNAARILAQFADFNAGGGTGLPSRSRDWYMASNVLAALTDMPPGTKAVYWAHNAHVTTADRPGGGRPTGALLRDVLGCAYGALGIAFGEGSFVAQIPNDIEDRLAVSTLPPTAEESIDAVMGAIGNAGAVASWSCPVSTEHVPGWLRASHPMHWIGGLFTPGSLASETYRSFDLLHDFDALAYLPQVTAEDRPADRSLVPPRAP